VTGVQGHTQQDSWTGEGERRQAGAFKAEETEAGVRGWRREAVRILQQSRLDLRSHR
jgi:hypothetical protein